MIVLENLLFILSISTLVRFGIEELCQLKNNNYYDEKKNSLDRCGMDVLYLYIYILFSLKLPLTFWYQNC